MRWSFLLSSFMFYWTTGLAYPFDIDLSKVKVQSGSKVVYKQGNENNIIGQAETNTKNITLTSRNDTKQIDKIAQLPQENATLNDWIKTSPFEEKNRDQSTSRYNETKRKTEENVPVEKEPEANKSSSDKPAIKSSVNVSKEELTQTTTQRVTNTDKVVHISIINDAVDLPAIQENAPIDIPISRPGTRISIFQTVIEPGLKFNEEKSGSVNNERNINKSDISNLAVMKLQNEMNTSNDHKIFNNMTNEKINDYQIPNNETLAVTPISQKSTNISDIEMIPTANITISSSQVQGTIKQQDSNETATNKTNLESIVRGEIMEKNGVSVVVSADINHTLDTTKGHKVSESEQNITTNDTIVDKTKSGSVLKEPIDVTSIEEGEPVDIPIPRPGTQQAIYFNTVVEPQLRDSTLRAIDVVKSDAAHEGIEIKNEPSDLQKVVETISKEKVENDLIPKLSSLSVAVK